jgi:hypothetical protein
VGEIEDLIDSEAEEVSDLPAYASLRVGGILLEHPVDGISPAEHPVY